MAYSESVDFQLKRIEEQKQVLDGQAKRLKTIGENPLIIAPEKLEEEVEKWHIVHPRRFSSNEMLYSPEQYNLFCDDMTSANKKIDFYISKLIHGAEFALTNRFISHPGYSDFEPLKIEWRTYALANFLNSPKLGKAIHIDGPETNCVPPTRIAFEMIHTEKGVKPSFYISFERFLRWNKYTEQLYGVFQEIKEDMEKENPTDLAFVEGPKFAGIVPKNKVHDYW